MSNKALSFLALMALVHITCLAADANITLQQVQAFVAKTVGVGPNDKPSFAYDGKITKHREFVRLGQSGFKVRGDKKIPVKGPDLPIYVMTVEVESTLVEKVADYPRSMAVDVSAGKSFEQQFFKQGGPSIYRNGKKATWDSLKDDDRIFYFRNASLGCDRLCAYAKDYVMPKADDDAKDR